jgi:Fe2+ or Zn2+ uptake regulation protein
MVKETPVTTQILKYLEANPQAGDTLEGIARWWLLQQQVNDSVNAIHQALEQLKTKGFVEERKAPNGQTIYLARARD